MIAPPIVPGAEVVTNSASYGNDDNNDKISNLDFVDSCMLAMEDQEAATTSSDHPEMDTQHIWARYLFFSFFTSKIYYVGCDGSMCLAPPRHTQRPPGFNTRTNVQVLIYTKICMAKKK